MAGPQPLSQVRAYIAAAWHTLSRSMLQPQSFVDPKLVERPFLYLPFEMEIPEALRSLEGQSAVRIAHLPATIRNFGDLAGDAIPRHGLLYLPHRYVVPGGMFNEMYGWDSYFIIRGLLCDGHFDLALGMVENLFFEIEHYGAVLNANRTYYLTRSQPPFLTSMIWAIYQHGQNLDWLSRAYEYAVRDHHMWSRAPRLAAGTGLSRYFDHGDGPVPEMAEDPAYYSDVACYLLTNLPDSKYLCRNGEGSGMGPVFTLQCSAEDRLHNIEHRLRLSADFYKGDRAMRESGFDVTFRFGEFSGSTHHFAPVCLNSLIYKAERDLELFARLLGRHEDSRRWSGCADRRRAAMQQHLWDEERGLFFDHDCRQQQRSRYEYATTFYPLWAGLATEEQARAVAANLAAFEQPGGVTMSSQITGTQWDLPYGWAPAHLLVTEGLRRYGFTAEADRVAGNFLSMVVEDFERTGTLREKYNVVTRSSNFQVTAGYKENVVGFGWTNGVVLALLEQLGIAKQESAPPLTPPMQSGTAAPAP